MSGAPPIEVRAVPGVRNVDGEAWDRVVGPDATPFQLHAFLAALEEAGCVGPGTGWEPVALAAYDAAGTLVGVASAYVKGHSMGEFVYDWSWADAAQRMGAPYYPKLVLAAPFSPAAGRRLHAAPDLAPGHADAVRRALLEGAVALADEVGCHGVHVLFCEPDEIAVAERLGFCHRLGVQFHWLNDGYGDFEDFLGRFKSKRRNQIRRERRRVADAGVEIRHFLGAEVEDAHLSHAFRFYASTVDSFAWVRRYLNARFFELLWRDLRPHLQLTFAYLDGRPLAGTMNLQKGARRFGRYWGCDVDVDSLHFEVCAYAAIEDCIRQGLQVFEAGAGGGSHKLGRGFLPARTHSAHLLFEPRFHAAVASFCREEAAAIERDVASARESVFTR